MIFATVGTHESQFDRLMLALELLPRDQPLVVQHGSSVPGPAWARSIPFLDFDEVVGHVRAADIVISHAGVGSIMVALANGRRPIVVPRLARYDEVVDDHQLRLGRRLDEAGLVVLVEDPADLAEALPRAQAPPAALPGGAQGLHEELRAYLDAHIATA
jgi:UDP-N-acetylglucosamine transferase subunit ALG13